MSDRDGNNDALATAYTGYASGLAAVLNLEAGAFAAIQVVVYTTELASFLDLDGGLEAILRRETIGTVNPTTTSAGHLTEVDDLTTGKSKALVSLDAIGDTSRFILRTRRPYGQLRSALHVDCELLRCQLEARALLVRLAADAQTSSNSTFNRFRHKMDTGPELSRSLATARMLAIDNGLGDDVVEAVTASLNHAIALDRAWRKVAAASYNGKSHSRALRAASVTAHNLAETLGQAIALTRHDIGRHARDLSLQFWDEADASCDSSLEVLLERVIDLGDDFTGSDLHAANIGHAADLTGIRWSSTTLWPPAWVDRVRAMSIQTVPGIFLIAGDAGKRSSLQQVHT